MLAYLSRFCFFAVLLSNAISLFADCEGDFLTCIARDIKRRNCWPNPFVCPDRQATRIPFAIMVNNGWRRQNMLGNFYFEPKTGQLNEAGKLKIRWILYEAPEQHRVIYVHIGPTTEETAARMASVRSLVVAMVPQSEIPPIMQTKITDDGSPADRIELIDRKYQSSIPTPRLPPPDNQSGSMSSSNSGQ